MQATKVEVPFAGHVFLRRRGPVEPILLRELLVDPEPLLFDERPAFVDGAVLRQVQNEFARTVHGQSERLSPRAAPDLQFEIVQDELFVLHYRRWRFSFARLSRSSAVFRMSSYAIASYRSSATTMSPRNRFCMYVLRQKPTAAVSRRIISTSDSATMFACCLSALPSIASIRTSRNGSTTGSTPVSSVLPFFSSFRISSKSLSCISHESLNCWRIDSTRSLSFR